MLNLLLYIIVAYFSFVKGFIMRKDAPCKDNRFFHSQMRYNFLLRLKAALPKNVLNKSWPKAPELLTQVSNYLCFLYFNTF